jgi:hypothetical protein
MSGLATSDETAGSRLYEGRADVKYVRIHLVFPRPVLVGGVWVLREGVARRSRRSGGIGVDGEDLRVG